MRVVKCPECDEKIEVESAMEGRRVACPECGERFTVPGVSRSDYKEAARPRKKRRKEESGPKWGLIAGIAMGAVGLVIGGIVINKATRPKPDAAIADPTDKDKAPLAPTSGPGLPLVNLPTKPLLPPEPPLPAGWIRYASKDVNLSAHFPGDPSGPAESESDMGGHRVKNRHYHYDLPGTGGAFALDIMILPAGASFNDEQRGQFLRLPRHQIVRLGKGQVTAERATTLAGEPATEFEFTAADMMGVYRYGFVRSGDNLMFVMATAGGPKVSPVDRQAFLNSIRPVGR